MRQALVKGLILATAGSSWPRGEVESRELLPAANRPLIAHALQAMGEAGATAVAVVVSAASARRVRDAIGDGRRHGVRVRYIRARTTTSLLEALVRAEAFLDGARCVAQRGDVMHADGLGALIAIAREHELDALVPFVPGPRPTVADIDTEAALHVLAGHGDAAAGGRWADTLVSSPLFVASLRAAGESPRLPDALELLVARGGRARAHVIDAWTRRVSSWEDLLDANRVALERVEPDHRGLMSSDSSVQGRVAIAAGATLESTVVRGPAIIGRAAELRYAYIGPYSSVGENVLVEGSEVENSIVLDGARIQHLSGRLESSVVGRDARVFRDFSLPRALRLQVADGDQIAIG